MQPYHTTLLMYRILFGIGIFAFIAGVALSVWSGQALFGLVFGGLGIIAFLTYFVGRPLQALEENLNLITWLGIIYNTYWTRLMYSVDQRDVHKDLQDATQDAINQIDRLLDKHTLLSGKRPGSR
jgi:hypothetical protein